VEPVVAKTGYIFERSLVETYLEQHDQCPITNQPLSKEDLFPVKAVPADIGKDGKMIPSNIAVLPKSPAATSIPSLLKSLQDEWDATVLEAHSLKVQNAALRTELSRALYQHDAACRVIARMMEEKEVAIQQLNEFKAAMKSNGVNTARIPSTPTTTNPATPAKRAVPAEAMDVDEPTMAIPEHLANRFDEVSKRCVHMDVILNSATCPNLFCTYHVDAISSLSASRKHRKNEETATPDLIKQFQMGKLFDTTFAKLSKLFLVHPSPGTQPPTLVLAVGESRGVQIFSYETKKKVGTLPLDQIRVDLAVVLQHDEENPIFAVTQKTDVVVVSLKEELQRLKLDTDIISIAPHPSGDCIAVSLGSKIQLYETQNLKLIYQIDQPSDSSLFESVAFHPDGMLLGASTGKSILVYSVTDKSLAATLDMDPQSHGIIKEFAFSENGFHLATLSSLAGTKETSLLVWDLRKLTITSQLPAPNSSSTLAFDYTGQFLVVPSHYGIQFYHHAQKKWHATHIVEEETRSVAWDFHARALLCCKPNQKSIFICKSDE
jgi:pre-mRNA-processing factor 19